MSRSIDFQGKNDYYLEKITGLVVIDMKGIIRYVNAQCKDFFGYKNDQIIGKHILDVFPETKMLENLKSYITEPQIVFYKSEKGIGISTHVPLLENGKKIGLMEYDLIQEEKAFYELTDQYNLFLANELKALRKRIVKLESSKYTLDNIIGSSKIMIEMKNRIKAIAKSNSTVLIMGETGTGKELVAHAIHNLSNRNNKAFAKVNASAFPENLVESELFGYEKGAFTGANKEGKMGKFEYANNGTLFIDEIHQMPLSIQPKLLRALQEHEIEPIGSNVSVPIDVRIITAANISLENLVENNKFREDLYYRLNVIKIEIPPLRKHLDDIEDIAYYHLEKLNTELGLSISKIDPEVIKLLEHYDWPGNVRELRNVIERAMNFAVGNTLTKKDFNFFINKKQNLLPERNSSKNLIEDAKNQAERDLLNTVLKHFGNNKSQAAKFLNISRPLLYQKMHRLGIK